MYVRGTRALAELAMVKVAVGQKTGGSAVSYSAVVCTAACRKKYPPLAVGANKRLSVGRANISILFPKGLTEVGDEEARAGPAKSGNSW